MFEATKRALIHKVPLTIAPFVLVLGGCDPDPHFPTGCLVSGQVPDTLTGKDPPPSIRLAGVCEKETRLRGYLSAVLLVPTDSTLRPDRFTLFLEGHPMPGLQASALGIRKPAIFHRQGETDSFQVGDYRIVEFSLRRTGETRETWSRIIRFARDRSITVGIGVKDGNLFPILGEPDPKVQIRFPGMGSWEVSLVFFLSIIWLVGILSFFDNTRTGTDENAPFSLSKVLMLYWTFLISAGFAWIWVMTGEFTGILNNQSLILMGVQGGTLAGAAGLNARVPPEKRRVSHIKEEKIPGFFLDLLADRQGRLAIHRFQNLVWHLTLGPIFLVSVLTNLWFPEFDDTILVLLGVGNGIYLGGKLGEE